MSRPFLEHTVRQRLEAMPAVRIVDRTSVAGLTTDETGSMVTGVRLESGEAVACDLVVDATRRQAEAASSWRSSVPAATSVRSRRGHALRHPELLTHR